MPKLPASINTTLPCPRTSATVLHPSPPWHTVLPGKPCTRMSIENPPTVIVGCVAGAFMARSLISPSARSRESGEPALDQELDARVRGHERREVSFRASHTRWGKKNHYSNYASSF